MQSGRPFKDEHAMKQPDNTADKWSFPVVAVQPEAKAVLSDREIALFFASHLGSCNELVRMIREKDFHRKVLETSIHRTPCGRKFLLTTEYECSTIILELIEEQ
jgi:hypothetical protein